MSARNANLGFSLLEVLVAFTILAMLLGALFQVFSGGMHAARSGDRHTRATIIAQSRMAAVGTEQPLAEGVDNGRVEDYDWRVTIGPYSDDQLSPSSALPQAFSVNVEVFWEEGGAPQSVSLTSMRLGAAGS